MKFSFKAKIYKVGINPCVKIPFHITDKMIAAKGYIPVKGKINNYPFEQTLCPVKNKEHRLYVNGPMLKGSKTKVGDVAKFTIEQTQGIKKASPRMPKEFKNKLENANLLQAFKKLIPSRQKDILKYLNYLKTDEARKRNFDKVINDLKKKAT